MDHNKVQVSTIVALLLLVLQNAASIILQHKIQSRTTEDKRFDPLTGVLLSELLKLTISLICITQAAQEQKQKQKQKSIITTLKTNHEEATLPALLYTAASVAQSIGASHLTLLPYLALSQTKLILTPLLATLLLHQKFTRTHWTSTLTMTAGIILAQAGASASPQNQLLTAASAHPLPGVLAMLLSGASVALGGISIERSLKRADADANANTTASSFFVRNAQLAAHSLLFALFSFIWKSNCTTSGWRFFDGFTSLVWVFVILQACGGFLVAWCVRVTSSVTKNYAQGLGFAIAVLGPLVVERRDIDVKLSVGVVLVLGAVVGSVLGSIRVTGLMEKREVKGAV